MRSNKYLPDVGIEPTTCDTRVNSLQSTGSQAIVNEYYFNLVSSLIKSCIKIACVVCMSERALDPHSYVCVQQRVEIAEGGVYYRSPFVERCVTENRTFDSEVSFGKSGVCKVARDTPASRENRQSSDCFSTHTPRHEITGHSDGPYKISRLRAQRKV